MDDTEWHRIFNIIDARHDGNKCSGVRGPSIKDDKLFKDALILLFGESVTNDKPHFANDNGRYYMEVLEGQNIVNPFTRAILVEGQQDNMLPTRFNMRSMMTLSQLYDRIVKGFNRRSRSWSSWENKFVFSRLHSITIGYQSSRSFRDN